MKSKLLHEDAGERTFALIFQTGDAVMEPLLRFAHENQVTAARFSGIGAFERVTLGYFDWNARKYKEIPMTEQVEVVSLAGDVALEGDDPRIHAHVVVADSDARAYGGHLMDAIVRPTLELVVVDTPAHLRKRMDSESGLALIDPDL